ncbi:replication endonuclease [Laribacter hongkongensis]|uniref:replication endonuclease n=1 Tax=Laribacter hongkongensis TaxID=168471 RepID=UPI001EFC335C|nr:replication endonuclease [Laribacter hongkongensis]MCG9093784.1 replication endonuclease [Laribacter hongkongensis]
MLSSTSAANRRSSYRQDVLFAEDCFSVAPAHLSQVAKRKYSRTYFSSDFAKDGDARRTANLGALSFRALMAPKDSKLRLPWSREEQNEKAVEVVNQLTRRLGRHGAYTPPRYWLPSLMALANQYGVYLHDDRNAPSYARQIDPPGKKQVTPDSFLKRLLDEQFWRMTFRRVLPQLAETHARSMGLVSKTQGLYVSDYQADAYRRQAARSREYLKNLIVTNEDGYSESVLKFADSTVSNPRNRYSELMVRMSGTERIAKALGFVSLFVTLTCPSRFHAIKLIGKRKTIPNRKFAGATPADGQRYLTRYWALVRAQFHRQGIKVFGFRIAEPHHDGTPHWHLLLYVRPEHADVLTELLTEHYTRDDQAELRNRHSGQLKTVRRVKIKWLDSERSATGYVAKYIAKNVDGCGSNGESIGMNFDGLDAPTAAQRVRAWASLWRIRQFQQIGGAPVTLYRELRRIANLDSAEFDSDALDAAVAAANQGDWEAYEYALGFDCPRKDRPLDLTCDEERPNKYGELVHNKIIGVVDKKEGVFVRSRLHEWTVEFRTGGREADRQLGFMCNNCNDESRDGTSRHHEPRSLSLDFEAFVPDDDFLDPPPPYEPPPFLIRRAGHA